MVDEFLKYPYWILTSRPYAALGIEALVDANVENVGFTSETIGSYIHQSFSLKLKNQAKTALQKIRQNPFIFGLSHIPINLELVSAILEFEFLESAAWIGLEKKRAFTLF